MTRTPRKCRSSSGPGGHTPLSQSHMLNVTLVFNISACSESRRPASSYARAFTHPQLERQGGNRPLWKRPGAMRPRKRRNSSGPGGHPPPVSQPCTLGEVLVTCRSSTYCLSVGVSVWLRSRALRTAGARALPHTLFTTPLGVPMWHACSRILCLFIVTMRPSAPSDISEDGSGYESG